MIAVRLDAAAQTAAQPVPAAPAHDCTCRECGAAYVSARAEGGFCSARCRAAWNNRRAKRGAEAYDLLMALRYDRALARRLKIWRLLCRMAMQFRAEDQAARAGRPSWRDPRLVLAERPYLSAAVLTHNAAGNRR